MREQKIFWLDGDFKPIEDSIKECGAKRIFLVCGNSVNKLEIGTYFPQLTKNAGAEIVKFSDFEPNPCYRSVVSAVNAFRERHCDFIFAIGGGSAIDVAKCVKRFALSDMPPGKFPQSHPPNDIPLAAMPTTAGSGSESTQFAVIYLDGEKQSVTDGAILPQYVFLDSGTLKTLPAYQKKSAMADALCHAVEAYWSINSNGNVKGLSRCAIQLILKNAGDYIGGSSEAARQMMKAANLAGQAINIARTTAAHAMSYKLTSLFGIAHGQAAFICLLGLLFRLSGRAELAEPLEGLAEIMGGEPRKVLLDFYSKLNLETPICRDKKKIHDLACQVNEERLNNFPVKLTEQEVEDIYGEVLGGDAHI